MPVVFETRSPSIAPSPNRVDIACFVGFVSRRSTEVPIEIRRWLQDRQWPASDLLDVPVPIDRWEVFDRLFAWEQRDYTSGLIGATYLGAAVRSFFAQGGQQCYVIRVGDAFPFGLPRSDRLKRLTALIPGYPNAIRASAVDRSSWSSVGHLFGLPDVSFLALPDLAELVAIDRIPLDPSLPILPSLPEQFVECAAPEPAPKGDRAVRFLSPPRCDDAGYEIWVTALNRIAQLLAARSPLREIQLVAAVPLPDLDSRAAIDLMEFLTPKLSSLEAGGIGSAFVQLVYPWARGAIALPNQIEPPEGLLCGLLAVNALQRGTFRSAANGSIAPLQDLDPLLSGVMRDKLQTRISLLGASPSGWRLLSDVTTSADEIYRPANVNRLVAAIVRAARNLGEAFVFEPSSELLWMRLRTSLERLLLEFWQAGALQGTPTEAFQIRCDRTTMTQTDLDAGRAIVTVQFTAAMPIETILISLAIDDSGQVALLPAIVP